MFNPVIFSKEWLKPWLRNPYKRFRRFLQRFMIDAYIVSFPKCGRTWLRCMLGKAICLKYGLPEELMLNTFRLTSLAGLLRTEFTHDYSDNAWLHYTQLPTNKRRYAKKKVIFLARNIKDVLVSYYFHCTKRSGEFSGDISSFIRNEYLGVKKVITFYNIWYENRNVPLDFLFIRYEEMHRSAKEVLRETLNFLGMKEVDDYILEEAVAFARFENMQKMEKEGHFKTGRLKPADLNDPESYKTRRGKVGGYVDYLSEEDIRYIDQVIEEMGCPFEQMQTL